MTLRKLCRIPDNIYCYHGFSYIGFQPAESIPFINVIGWVLEKRAARRMTKKWSREDSTFDFSQKTEKW